MLDHFLVHLGVAVKNRAFSSLTALDTSCFQFAIKLFSKKYELKILFK